MLNNFDNLKIEIFGASHSPEIGVSIEGLPKGANLNLDELQLFVDRRKAQKSAYSTQRLEADKIIIKSGYKDGKLTGETFVAVVKNSEQHSSDYESIKNTPRPSHADYVAYVKFGGKEDMRGGGRFSGRLTIALCIAGGIAKQIINCKDIDAEAYISSIGNIDSISYKNELLSREKIQLLNPLFRVANDEDAEKMMGIIESARKEGDSIGGVVECIGYNIPAGLGETLFGSLESKLSAATFAIPAVKGIEFGAGFNISKVRGSEANDCFYYDERGQVKTYTNNNGGINGGIANGMPITMRVAFKPTPSIAKPQQTINIANKTNTTIVIPGRHDACIVPRAVVCVESVMALVILDCILTK